MPKKLTHGFVKKSFEAEGYILVSKEYINSSTKLDYICPEGHKHSITWGHWQNGNRCYYCFGRSKPLIEDIRKSFESEGYILLSKKYVNNVTNLKYICPNDHVGTINWNNWKSGSRCYECAVDVTKVDMSTVKCSFEKEGYTLLSTSYINTLSKLRCICPNGHEYFVSWNSWNSGRRCVYCYKDSIIFDFEDIKKLFSEEGYTLLSKKYKNAYAKLSYVCLHGHKHSITLNKWKCGRRCPTCAIINRTGPASSSWKGGISFEPYCEAWKDKEYKQDIKDRDGNKCLNPYCDSPDKNDLSIHHIDFNKKNCHPDNLITVCRSCNSRANKDRDWHKAWYQAIMNKRYNYKYKSKGNLNE